MATWIPANKNMRVLIGLEPEPEEYRPRFGDHSKCELDGALCAECSQLWQEVIREQSLAS